jgi:molybdate transport repressor ModE-like protein
MLNFERMRILHAIASHGSVNAAAQALHVTNSAVSQQIAKLESELGQSLLQKKGRGVCVTDAAAGLVAHTKRMLALMESAEAEFDAQRNSVFGHITVAVFPTAARGLAPQALQSLCNFSSSVEGHPDRTGPTRVCSVPCSWGRGLGDCPGLGECSATDAWGSLQGPAA